MEFAKQSWILFLIFCIAEGGTKTLEELLKAVVNEKQNTPPPLIPCENGWYFFRETCYKVFDKKKGLKWHEAAASCSSNRGSLVTIQSQEVQDFLAAFLLLNARTNVWIGLHDRDTESRYMWDDGSVVSYTNWETGEPTGRRAHQEDCVEMRYLANGKIGRWNDIGCDYTMPYICQSSKSEQSLNHDPRFCTDENDGAWNYLNFCYHIVEEDMSWDDAENYCKVVLKGHLLSIRNSKAETFVNYAFSNFNKEFWIGIKEDDFEFWSSGWPVKIKRWEDRHQKHVNGTCTYMKKPDVWSSAPCNQKLPFVCEVIKEETSIQEAPKGWKCPELSEDWIDLGGESCYIFETRKPKKWLEANFACSKKGGHLASIHSLAESNAIHPHVAGVHDKLMIGLHRSSSDRSVFEWADGSKLDYENWGVGEPNDINEGCSEVWTEDMIWNDLPCDIAKGYICSTKKVPPTDGKGSTFVDSQHLVDSNCSGKVSYTMLAVLLAVIVVLFITGFTIYKFKDNWKTSNNKPWKNFFFSLTSRDRSGSPNEHQMLYTKSGE